MTGRHNFVGFTGLGFIEGCMFVAAPGTGQDRDTGQRTEQPIPIGHDAAVWASRLRSQSKCSVRPAGAG